MLARIDRKRLPLIPGSVVVAQFPPDPHVRTGLIDGRTLDDVRDLAQAIGFRLTHLAPNQGYGIAWLEPET